MGPWLDSVTGWLTVNPQWLAAAVFIVAFVECLAIAGLIVPGTVLLFAVAVLAGSGALSLSETLVLGFLAGVLGDVVSYFIGRHFHQNIRRLPGLRHHPEWIVCWLPLAGVWRTYCPAGPQAPRFGCRCRKVSGPRRASLLAPLRPWSA
jgi:membrane protein YqaA with SNARE-associated domain